MDPCADIVDIGNRNWCSCTVFVESTLCGPNGPIDFDCEVYRHVDSCDISDYFRCLTETLECDPRTGELTIDPNGDCGTYATC